MDSFSFKNGSFLNASVLVVDPRKYNVLVVHFIGAITVLPRLERPPRLVRPND